MKNILQLKPGIMVVVMLLPFCLSAHFGSKGPYGGTVSCIITHDSLVYIGTANSGVFEATSNQVTAWRARPVGLTSGRITALAHSGSYLFAGTADSGVFIFNGFAGADRYWIKINSGLGNLRIRSLLAIDSVTILAGTDGGLFKTGNKGASWTAIYSTSLDSSAIASMVKAGGRVIAASLDGGVFSSDNQGSTWSDFNDSITGNAGSTISLSYNSSNQTLMVSNNSGLFMLAAADITTNPAWIRVHSGLPSNVIVRNIANNGSSWYIATDKGVFTSPAGTIAWTAANSGISTSNVTAIATVQDWLIAGTVTEGVFKATAGTYNWSAINTNFNAPLTFAMAADGDSVVVAATEKGIYVSTDLATTYARSNTGLDDSLNISDLVITPDHWMASTRNAGVFVSTTQGKTWFARNGDLPNLHITKLFYAGGRDYAFDVNGKIFEWDTAQARWEERPHGLPAALQPTLMVHYANTFILGTLGNGVYLMGASDTSWTAANTGLSNLQVTSVTASGNKLFAGTAGSGVFVSGYKTISWSQAAATRIPHTDMIGLNGNYIQAMAAYAGYVYASYKGGVLATSDNGASWIAGGNQFNLPSFTDVNRISFVSSRVFVLTETNALYSNALAELPAIPDTLIVSADSILAPHTEVKAWFVSVTSNRSWTVTSSQSWITLNKNAGILNSDFIISIAANTGSSVRTGVITVTAGAKIQTIFITQAAASGLYDKAGKQVDLIIYPNPSKGLFNLLIDGPANSDMKITVYNLSGQVMTETFIPHSETSAEIETNLVPGIYFVELKTNQASLRKKVIVQ